MKKKGFVFIETIIVLMIVTLSLTLMMSSYTLIKTKSLEKEKYDKVSDKYFLYAISNLGTSSQYNYSVIADTGYLKITPDNCSNTQESVYKITGNSTNDTVEKINCSLAANKDEEECIFFKIFEYNASKANTHSTQINTSSFSKTNTDDPNCKTVLKELNIEYLYVVPNVQKALTSSTATQIYDNGTIDYMKTLKKCYDDVYVDINNGDAYVSDTARTCDDAYAIRYLIGVFYRHGEYYFASIEI